MSIFDGCVFRPAVIKFATRKVKLDFVVPEVTRPATHTFVGYPSLPACLPKLLGTQETN